MFGAGSYFVDTVRTREIDLSSGPPFLSQGKVIEKSTRFCPFLYQLIVHKQKAHHWKSSTYNVKEGPPLNMINLKRKRRPTTLHQLKVHRQEAHHWKSSTYSVNGGPPLKYDQSKMKKEAHHITSTHDTQVGGPPLKYDQSKMKKEAHHITSTHNTQIGGPPLEIINLQSKRRPTTEI